MKKLLLILLCLPMIGFGQTWQYSEDGNAFDGKYKTAIVKGSGNNYPYNTPSLCIQKIEKSLDFKFYISGAGFYQNQTGISITWIFDSEPNFVYKSSNLNISKNGEILFLDDFMKSEGGFKIEGIEFIEQFQAR